MTTRLPLTLGACLLVAAGCASSGDNGPSVDGPTGLSDEAFCAALEDWMDVLDGSGAAMEDFGVLLSDAETVDDFPTIDETHALGATILSAVQEADDLLPTILANTSDPDVVGTMDELHVILTDFQIWMGESARDTDSTEAFAILISTDFNSRLDAMNDSVYALDTDAADTYVATTCPDLVDILEQH